MLIGLPSAPAAVMVTSPVYWPGESKPAFTETLTEAGVVPVVPEEPTETASQGTLFPGVAVTVNGTPGGVDVTAICCAAGGAPPANWVNWIAAVGAERVACWTVNVTGIWMGLLVAPGEVIVTIPL